MNELTKRLISGVCITALLFKAEVYAANGFVVQDIKVVGLQRVSTGTVLNYLPVQVGEEINSASTGQIIRSLYETGFFQSVELQRQGNTLIVEVERATIGSINVVGNSEIPSDKMKEILKDLGLVQGRVFQRASLERLEKELKQVYNIRGKYNSRVDSTVNELTENRVAITVTISEGRVSRISQIKIIGNHDFSDSELLSELDLSTSGVFTYFTKKDQYSKTAMDASLESLRTFYLDRGYLKFNIISSQVLLSPDKKDVFINIHIEEGPQYHFEGYEIVGRTIVPKEKLENQIKIKPGKVFSRKEVTESISAIGQVLGDEGYGFPTINTEPRIDEEKKTVFIVFQVDPGRHIYVRRINFHGNTKTGDYVLRNIIRQNEGSLLSLHNIKESERQLHLLNYLKNVNVKTTPVPGTNNQVDLDVDVEEAHSAEASASAGYGTNGPQFNVSFNQYNFMGTGRTVGAGFSASYWGQNYSLNYYNPFYTNTGIGRGVDFYFSKVDPQHLDVASYGSDRYGVNIFYNMRLNEYSSLQYGYGYQGFYIQSAGIVPQYQNFVDLYGRNFKQIRLNTGWNRNTYDKVPYPTSGTNQQSNFLVALPADHDSFKYYKASYQAKLYYPLPKDFIFTLYGNIAYGNTFNSEGLPFFENYFAGGIAQPGQVRGYQSYSLGPQDFRNNSLGANFLVNGSIGMALPYPLSRETFRTTLFLDGGNVYAEGTPFLLSGTLSGPVRYSAGVAVEWRSPFGPLAFSLAKPLNKQPLDEEEPFQFTVSSSF
jgi:outer membrane protein insertion porin family